MHGIGKLESFDLLLFIWSQIVESREYLSITEQNMAVLFLRTSKLYLIDIN